MHVIKNEKKFILIFLKMLYNSNYQELLCQLCIEQDNNKKNNA